MTVCTNAAKGSCIPAGDSTHLVKLSAGEAEVRRSSRQNQWRAGELEEAERGLLHVPPADQAAARRAAPANAVSLRCGTAKCLRKLQRAIEHHAGIL